MEMRADKGGERVKLFEIYFHDLTEDAQRRYLEFQGVQKPEELNADLFPIFVLEREEVEDENVCVPV